MNYYLMLFLSFSFNTFAQNEEAGGVSLFMIPMDTANRVYKVINIMYINVVLRN